MNKVKKYFDSSYLQKGIGAQRIYPNEFFIRALNFVENKKMNKRLLDFGSGLGSNFLPALEKGYTIDAFEIVGQANKIAKLRYKKYKSKIKFFKMNIFEYITDYKYDVVSDIFSSYVLDNKEGDNFLSKCSALLKTGGYFISYFPSKNSDTWLDNKKKSNLKDSNTLMGIFDKKSPYYGNNYNFRFLTKKNYEKLLLKNNFEIKSFEKIIRIYDNGKKFEFLNVIAKKK